MLIDLIDVKPQDDYVLLLEFENGEKKSLIVNNYLVIRYEPLKEKHFLNKQELNMERSYGQMRKI
ncbi:MAG: DUF2442 domain-containing protein [Campylobacterales bacterium]